MLRIVLVRGFPRLSRGLSDMENPRCEPGFSFCRGWLEGADAVSEFVW